MKKVLKICFYDNYNVIKYLFKKLFNFTAENLQYKMYSIKLKRTLFYKVAYTNIILHIFITPSPNKVRNKHNLKVLFFYLKIKLYNSLCTPREPL